MKYLIYIGIPFRFLLFCFMTIVLCFFEPRSAFRRSEFNWEWVITGKEQ
jgi:hypothetical protein